MMQYFLIMLSEDGNLELKQFDTLEGVAFFMRNLPESVQGYVIHGTRVEITVGPWRYLVHDSQTVPMFDAPTVGKIDKSANLGRGVTKPKGTDTEYKSLMAGMVLAPPTPPVDNDDMT